MDEIGSLRPCAAMFGNQKKVIAAPAGSSLNFFGGFSVIFIAAAKNN